MTRYYKVTYPDGATSIFDTNNDLAARLAIKVYEDQDCTVVEITKKEYKQLEREIM